MSNFTIEDLILQLELLVQQDEGERGIKQIALRGQLVQAAKKLIECHSVVIITGFPCLLDYEIPTETDGPLGALAIAKTCLRLGKRVAIVTDECNEQVLLAAAAASNLQHENMQYEHIGINMEDVEGMKEMEEVESEFSLDHQQTMSLVLESFPPIKLFDEKDQKRLDELMAQYDAVIAIERPGPSISGHYFTMKKRDMTDIISPLDRIITRDKITIGIGDGGNEVGMGKVYDKIIASTIPNATFIGCVISTDYLIVSSVSNWGGYALSAAMTALIIENNGFLPEADKTAMIDKLMSTTDEQMVICQRMIESGARDGITGKMEMYVDGMPLEISLDILQKLKEYILNYSH